MIDFLSILISPMTVLFLLITGCLIQEFAIINTIQRGSRRRKPRWLLLITIIWFFTITTNPAPRFIAGFLEDRYPVFDTPGCITGDTTIYILVLGAGYCHDPYLPPTGKLNPTSLGRLIEAVRIHKMISNSILVTFGQPVNTPAGAEEILARTAIEMGVDQGSVIWTGNAGNTWGEASKFTAKFGRESGVILVTDAIHMPRAMKKGDGTVQRLEIFGYCKKT